MASLSSFEKKWRSRFEKFAQYNNEAQIAGWSATGLKTRVRGFLRHWPKPKKKQNWLDAGCGAGTYTNVLLNEGQKVVALDYSYPTLVKSQRFIQQKVPLNCGDVTQLPFKANSFDGILCFGVMQALTEEQAAIVQFKTILKSGGQLWVDGLNIHCIPHRLQLLKRKWLNRPLHLRYSDPNTLIKHLKHAHMKNIQLYWLVILPKRLSALQGLVDSLAFQWCLKRCPIIGHFFAHSFLIHARVS